MVNKVTIALTAVIITAIATAAASAIYLILPKEVQPPVSLPDLVETKKDPGPAATSSQPSTSSQQKPQEVDLVPAPVLDDKGATDQGISVISQANNQFAFGLYTKLLKSQTGDFFFSPFSISSAVGMLYEGARENTAEEILSVFKFPSDNNERRSAIASICNQLNPKDAPYSLNAANALWVQKDYNLTGEYVDTLKNYYGAGANNLDFKSSAEESRQTINKWVEQKTNSKIIDLLPVNSVSAATRLVLTNAVYFKGTWAKPFDKDLTKEDNFYTNKNVAVKVQMMNKDSKFDYAYLEKENLQVLKIPYEGSRLSMMVLLPKGKDLGPLEKIISAENVKLWEAALSQTKVDVYLPKFSLVWNSSLKDPLKKMGIVSVFDGTRADLSGIDGIKDLFVNDVIHKAFVEVNEEGTEAAAATGVTVWTTSAIGGSTPTFRVDRPFIFLIKDDQTGNILFLGRVINFSK